MRSRSLNSESETSQSNPRQTGRRTDLLGGANVAAILALVGYVIWRKVAFLGDSPPLYLTALSGFVLVVYLRNVPHIGGLWWLWALVSVFWSLTPGNTLAAALWGVIYLAALAAGSSTAFTATLFLLLMDGVFSTVSMQLAGLQQYFSGSINYLVGAIAVAFLPVAMSRAVAGGRWGDRAMWSLAAGAAVAASAMSGSRAVYAALLIAVVLVLWRMRGQGAPPACRYRSACGRISRRGPRSPCPFKARRKCVGALLGLTFNVDMGHAPASGSEAIGAMDSRLQMWHQAVEIGLHHPLGTGFGSFSGTIRAFQLYPTINFSSAHNALLEVFATQGWVGLLLLAVLVARMLWSGWRDPMAWPFAVGTAAIWFTMSLDITWSMPVMPFVAFMGMGATQRTRLSYRRSSNDRWIHRRPLAKSLPVLILVVAVALMTYWYAPCKSQACALHRWLGFKPRATQLIMQAPEDRQKYYLVQLRRLYPKSLWVRILERDTAEDPIAKLPIVRGIARDFPLASPQIYLEWANLALSAGRTKEARIALETGLRWFPPDASPAGIPLASAGDQYMAWISRAHELLADLQ